MEINYELQPKDLIEYNKYAARQQHTHKPMVAVISFILITFLLADFIYAIIFGLADVWSFESFLTNLFIRLLIFAALLGFILIVFHLAQLRAGNFIAKNEANGLLCRHKIVLDEKELIEITNVNASRHAWSSVAQIEEIEKFLVITISSSGAFVIPKRYFQDREHIKKFIETAEYFRQNASNTFQLSYLTEYEKSLQ